MDVFRLLKRDHKEVKAIFKKLEKTSEDSQKARTKGFEQLERELSVHAELEEELFYPRLKEVKKLKDTVNEAFEEHHIAKVLLQELAETAPEDERWAAKLSVLKEMIEHHVEEEEQELFPKAARALGKDESKQLGKRIEAAKKEKLKSFAAEQTAEAPN